jgi:hypothetical protein
MPYRCPYRLSLSSQQVVLALGQNIKVLKDKDLEFANSIPGFCETRHYPLNPLEQRTHAAPAVT